EGIAQPDVDPAIGDGWSARHRPATRVVVIAVIVASVGPDRRRHAEDRQHRQARCASHDYPPPGHPGIAAALYRLAGAAYACLGGEPPDDVVLQQPPDEPAR